MTETEKVNGKITTISVQPSTLLELAEVMPKGWTWDRCIKELTGMWKAQQGKVVRTTGKPVTDNQTS